MDKKTRRRAYFYHFSFAFLDLGKVSILEDEKMKTTRVKVVYEPNDKLW